MTTTSPQRLFAMFCWQLVRRWRKKFQWDERFKVWEYYARWMDKVWHPLLRTTCIFCKHDGSGEYSSTFRLLSVSPIHALSGLDDEEDNIEEATNFNAQTTADHITDIFESFYDIPVVSNWAVCQTADNASLNKRITQLLGVPHIACYNHLLDKEVKQMIDESKNVPGEMGSVCNKVHAMMLEWKNSTNIALSC